MSKFVWKQRYQFQKRTLIIDGVSTSLALERIFWEEVDLFAASLPATWQRATRALLKSKPSEPNKKISNAGWIRIWILLRARAGGYRVRPWRATGS